MSSSLFSLSLSPHACVSGCCRRYCLCGCYHHSYCCCNCYCCRPMHVHMATVCVCTKAHTEMLHILLYLSIRYHLVVPTFYLPDQLWTMASCCWWQLTVVKTLWFGERYFQCNAIVPTVSADILALPIERIPPIQPKNWGREKRYNLRFSIYQAAM